VNQFSVEECVQKANKSALDYLTVKFQKNTQI